MLAICKDRLQRLPLMTLEHCDLPIIYNTTDSLRYPSPAVHYKSLEESRFYVPKLGSLTPTEITKVEEYSKQCLPAICAGILCDTKIT